jgi:hypothetical protein
VASTVACRSVPNHTVLRVRVARSQCAEAVDRMAVLGALAGGLALRGRRDGRLGDGRAAPGLGGSVVVVVEQQGSQCLAHVPFEVVGEQAEKDVGADAVLVPVIDGPHFEIDGLAAAKGAFDGRQGFVGSTVASVSSSVFGTAVRTT